jgi:FlaA1/EpsC-like NDP-sugar epimerase
MLRSSQLRRKYAIFHDILASVLAWVLAFELRFNFQIPSEFYDSIINNGLWVLLIQLSMFFQFGLYRGIWRFASLPDLKRIIYAVVAASFLVLAIKLMVVPKGVIPRSVHILDPVLLIMMMGGSRFVYRAWKDHHLYAMTSAMGKPVIILGAEEVAANLLNDLARSQDWRVVGLLDNQTNLHRRELKGVIVLGAIDELASFARDSGAEHVIIALSHEQHALKRHSIELANSLGLNILTVPSLDDLMSGKLSVSQIRKVEVEDLLGRDPVQLDEQGLHEIVTGQVVMVTGAGGSVGSELCRQLRKFQPRILICYDISEYSLYNLEQEFSTELIKSRMVYVVGDVKNEVRLMHILSKYSPSLVFHAAAYKHVPMMENENVCEALNNNVIGTHTLAQACQKANVKRFVLISTDKAVNPTNVMGASKRLAEMVCQGMRGESSTVFAVVRFGNVLGSSGSVIPKFRQQIAMGGPVTVTHPEITRYFMSIPEASQLVMQAGLMSQGGEIFVLDMGESVKIADLAREMIKLSGFQEGEIEVQYTGLRPGEKLYEELLADDEHTLRTPHPKLRVALARSVDMVWVEALLKWLNSIASVNEDVIKQQLKLWVEEYTVDIQLHSSDKPKITPFQSTTLH